MLSRRIGIIGILFFAGLVVGVFFHVQTGSLGVEEARASHLGDPQEDHPPPQTETVGVSITILSSGGGGAPPLPADVLFRGKAYPEAIVTILRNGSIISTLATAGSSGAFSRKLVGIPEGIHTFSFYAKDLDGRLSVAISLTLSIRNNTLTIVEGLVIPPTITAPNSVRRGAPLTIEGFAFPRSIVFLFFDPDDLTSQVTAADTGRWHVDFDTSLLRIGSHSVRSKTVTPQGEQSEFSQSVSFNVLEGDEPSEEEEPPEEEVPPEEEIPPRVPPIACLNGDSNGDGEVDLIDFSIMLFWWNTDDDCSDQNNDGTVDIIDASIMFFYWTD